MGYVKTGSAPWTGALWSTWSSGNSRSFRQSGWPTLGQAQLCTISKTSSFLVVRMLNNTGASLDGKETCRASVFLPVPPTLDWSTVSVTDSLYIRQHQSKNSPLSSTFKTLPNWGCNISQLSSNWKTFFFLWITSVVPNLWIGPTVRRHRTKLRDVKMSRKNWERIYSFCVCACVVVVVVVYVKVLIYYSNIPENNS